MFLEFTTDATVNDFGFRATYTRKLHTAWKQEQPSVSCNSFWKGLRQRVGPVTAIHDCAPPGTGNAYRALEVKEDSELTSSTAQKILPAALLGVCAAVGLALVAVGTHYYRSRTSNRNSVVPEAAGAVIQPEFVPAVTSQSESGPGKSEASTLESSDAGWVLESYRGVEEGP